MNKLKKLTVSLIILCFAFTSFGENLESIMKAHEEKVDKAKKSYEAGLKKLSEQTVKRLELLKKNTTRAGKLEDAIAIQNEINRLQGKAPMVAEKGENAEKGEGMEGGVPVPPGVDAATFSEKQAQRALRKRYIDFHEALIENKIENAVEYLDPSIRKKADKAILEGHLKIMAGFLQAFQIKKGGIDIEDFKFTEKLKEAKITGKTKSAISGAWNTNKDPGYWIYKRGEWFLGDKDSLEKLF